MVTGILLHCRNSCNSVIIPNTQLIPYKNTKIFKSLLEYTILRLLSQKTTLSFKSYIPYSFIFSHNLCTIAKNVVWDWNADITWYISFFNVCFGSTNKRKGIYPRYSCIFEWRFHNRSVTLFIQYVYQTPSYTVIKYHTLHITSP